MDLFRLSCVKYFDCVFCKKDTNYHNNSVCKVCLPWGEKVSIYNSKHISCCLCCSINPTIYAICEECQFANFRGIIVKNKLLANLDIILGFRFGSPNVKKSLENCATFIRKYVKHENHPEKCALSSPLNKEEFVNLSKLQLDFYEIMPYFHKSIASLIFSFKFLTKKDLPLLCIEHIFQETYPTDIFK